MAGTPSAPRTTNAPARSFMSSPPVRIGNVGLAGVTPSSRATDEIGNLSLPAPTVPLRASLLGHADRELGRTGAVLRAARVLARHPHRSPGGAPLGAGRGAGRR